MRYFTRSDWKELSKWLDVSREFWEAYTLFRLEDEQDHLLLINNKRISLHFTSEDTEDGPYVTVVGNCSDVPNGSFDQFFYLCEEAACTESLTTKRIIAQLYRIAWCSDELDEVEIEMDDTEKAYQTITEILTEMGAACFDAYFEPACLLGAGCARCVLKILDREILITATCNCYREECTDYWLVCLDTDRSLADFSVTEGWTPNDAIQKIMYLATEPECVLIDTTDTDWEYDAIKSIVVPAIGGLSYGKWWGKEQEERAVELHNKQIRIQLQYDSEEDLINACVECTTTGNTRNCVVDRYTDDPDELIRLVQKLAGEDTDEP